MKTTQILSILTLGLTLPATAADDIPERYKFERYAAILERSPFAVATAAVVPVQAPNFAKDLYIANAARSDEGDMVTLASVNDKNFKKYLTTKEPVEGYAIASIEWSEQIGKTQVTITKDGQSATLKFNQALLQQSLAGAQPVSPGAMNMGQPNPVPGVYPTPVPNMVRPAPIPTVPTPQPHVRGVIQKGAGARARPNVPAVPQPVPEEIDTEEVE